MLYVSVKVVYFGSVTYVVTCKCVMWYMYELSITNIHGCINNKKNVCFYVIVENAHHCHCKLLKKKSNIHVFLTQAFFIVLRLVGHKIPL